MLARPCGLPLRAASGQRAECAVRPALPICRCVPRPGSGRVQPARSLVLPFLAIGSCRLPFRLCGAFLPGAWRFSIFSWLTLFFLFFFYLSIGFLHSLGGCAAGLLHSAPNATGKGSHDIPGGQRARHAIDQTLANDLACARREDRRCNCCRDRYLRLDKILKLHLLPSLFHIVKNK